MSLFCTERSGGLYGQVLELAGIFRSGGGRALIVGGSVRDALLGRPVKDFDMEIYGLSPERVLELLKGVCEVDAVGMSFGVIKVKHREIDITLPRRENKTGAGHRGFLVEPDPGMDCAEAAARRDFTVNAIMYDPLREELIDPWHGAEDLRAGVLRHVSSHFSEDPLRVLRGMQFAARLGFRVAPETAELCAGLDQRELAVERIGTEWEKLLLQGEHISFGLDFLLRSRWIRFYPELEAAAQSSRWAGIGRFADACAARRPEERNTALLFMTAALTAFLKEDPGEVGETARCFCRRLWNREELISRAALLARTFRETEMMPQASVTLTLSRRLSLKLGGLELLTRLLRGAGRESTAASLRARGLEAGVFHGPPRPLLTGRHGIAAGLRPGPELGAVLDACFEAQLEGRFSGLEGAEAFLRGEIARRKGASSEKK